SSFLVLVKQPTCEGRRAHEEMRGIVHVGVPVALLKRDDGGGRAAEVVEQSADAITRAALVESNDHGPAPEETRGAGSSGLDVRSARKAKHVHRIEGSAVGLQKSSQF